MCKRLLLSINLAEKKLPQNRAFECQCQASSITTLLLDQRITVNITNHNSAWLTTVNVSLRTVNVVVINVATDNKKRGRLLPRAT